MFGLFGNKKSKEKPKTAAVTRSQSVLTDSDSGGFVDIPAVVNFDSGANSHSSYCDSGGSSDSGSCDSGSSDCGSGGCDF